MPRSSLVSILKKSKKRLFHRRVAKSRRSNRGVKGGQGAADYGVKLWGINQTNDPAQGNMIQAHQIKGGASYSFLANQQPPTSNISNTADLTKQSLDMQNAAVDNMTSITSPSPLHSQSVNPNIHGGRSRRSKKYRYTIKKRNGRRTKTIY